MHVDVIDTYEKFAGLRSNWDSIYSIDPEAQFFLSWIWLSQLFLRRPDSWCVLAASPNNGEEDYVAFFPLRPMTRYSKSRRKYISEIYMGGNFWADYTGLICHPDYERIAVPALANHVQKMCWDKLHFEYFCASESRTALLTEQFGSSKFRLTHRNRTSKADGINNLISPGVSLPGSFDDYLQSRISANTRQKMRRYQRKIDASHDLRVDESSPLNESRDLDAFVEYWTVRWAERKGKKVDTLARKYRQILEQGLEGGIVHLVVLRHRDHPVAVHASFIDRVKKCLLFFVAGRDQSWGILPSGLMLHAYSIRWAIENGFQTYDLLRGDEQYKYSLGATDQLLDSIRIERRPATRGAARIDPNALDFVLQDFKRRVANADAGLKQRLCQQLLNSWPDDEKALQRFADALIGADEHQAARYILDRLTELGA